MMWKYDITLATLGTQDTGRRQTMMWKYDITLATLGTQDTGRTQTKQTHTPLCANKQLTKKMT
jgi:hypothetical protein